MASTTVSFDIIAQDRASSKFDHLSRSVDHSGGALSKFSSIAKSAAKAGALAMGAGAVIAAKGLYEAAQGAVEDEAAAAKLATTLKTVAHATDGQVASVERWITAQGKALGVSDDDLRPSLQRLVEATHDVGKAQDLATLAMDVAAAKGKPLVSVSEALMKAYNGNIGALGRLGIKTKDAAGETISFDDATKQMADTFGGAAKAHTETLAGKMEILKLNISEAGESIGYKLLPYVSDAATWLGDHLPAALDATEKKAGPVFGAIVDGAEEAVDAVKPAVKEIVEAFGHLTDSGSDVDHIWGDVLLPTLKTAADVIGKVVDFVDELPGPVKSFGGEAVIAAAGMSKLTGALAASKETGFIATMTDSTKRTAALQSAAKTAAGAGGILLLTHAFSDASREGADFTGVLEGAVGGAGAGFAAGGPWGALIGAVGGGGLVALKAAFHDTKEEAKAADTQMRIKAGFESAKQGADDLADSLKGVVNEYGEVPRAAIEAGFWDGDKLSIDVQNLRDAGVSMDTIVSATMGQKDALDTVNAALDQQRDKLQDNYDAAEAAFNEAFYNENGFLPKDSANGPVVPRNSIIPEDENDALREANDALMAFDDTAKIFGDRVTDNTQKLRDHRTEVAHLAADLGVTVKEYNKFPDKVRTHFEEKGMVQNSQDAVRLIGHYKGLQSFKRIRTVATVAGVDLSAKQILKLQHRYDLTPRQVKTLFKQEGVQLSLKGIARIAKSQHLVKSDIKTLLEVNGVDATVKDVKRAEKQLLDTGKKSAHPEIKTDPIPAINDMHSVSRVLQDLDGDRADVYTYHHNVILPPEGRGSGGGAGGSDDDPTTPGRMMVGTLTPSGFSGATVTHVHKHQYPERVTLSIGGHEFEAVLRAKMRDEIEQDREFARIQGD